ncbi:MAG TPA: polysaccharide deacetylase family protein, partial [Clostridia bacterium]|nr:polysaccharide deacetylase family protein [Clostridia bacterium]
GANNKGVLNTVANQGYHNIYWSIDPKDWSGKSPDQILANIKQNIEPGAIILLHSSGNKNTIPNTIKALPRIIEFLLEEDYEIVTIPKLLLEDIYE